MEIKVTIVEHKAQRYDTVGDWFLSPEGNIVIAVSDTGNPDYNFLVAIHELVEAFLCLRSGVTQEQVDAWDMGPGRDLAEPGNDPEAPYHRQHMFADIIERLVARERGVDWKAYEGTLDDLIIPF